MIIKNETKGRIGLMGNPSDGYYGKTISFLFDNFSARASLWESPHLEILPNEQDRFRFQSLEELVEDIEASGYYGGIRLIKATIKKFSDYCGKEGIRLEKKNFNIQYNVDIPRHVGLGGSSAIIASVLKCLMQFYGVKIPLEIQPNLVLSVEKEELNLAAGLQDRVIQTWGGIVYMDFSRQIMQRQGYGKYQRLKVKLPHFFLAYLNRGKESNKFHSNLSYRYQRGERKVVEAMEEFARLTVQAKRALEEEDYLKLGELMDANFDLRRKITGDEGIGKENLEMIRIARDLGSPAKFSGSGGAVVGIIRNNFSELEQAYRRKRFNIVKVKHGYQEER